MLLFYSIRVFLILVAKIVKIQFALFDVKKKAARALIRNGLHVFNCSSIQLHIIKIRWIAVGFLVVELIDAHVGLLDFLGSIAEGIGDRHGEGHDDDHFGC